METGKRWWSHHFPGIFQRLLLVRSSVNGFVAVYFLCGSLALTEVRLDHEELAVETVSVGHSLDSCWTLFAVSLG